MRDGVRRHAHAADVRLTAEPPAAWARRPARGHGLLLLYAAAPTRPAASSLDPARGLVGRVLLAPLLGGALLSIVLLFFAVSRLLAPLRAVTDATRRLAAGDRAARVTVAGASEVADLSHAFNRMAESLERSETTRRQMVSDVAHELRTPLTNLRCRLEAMQDGLAAPDAAALRALHDETLLLARLVEDLQLLSLADAGRLPLERQRVDLREVAEGAITALAPRAETAGVSISLAAGAATFADCDPARIGQVFRNLLANALAHTPRGGDIRVTVEARDGSVVEHRSRQRRGHRAGAPAARVRPLLARRRRAHAREGRRRARARHRAPAGGAARRRGVGDERARRGRDVSACDCPLAGELHAVFIAPGRCWPCGRGLPDDTADRRNPNVCECRAWMSRDDGRGSPHRELCARYRRHWSGPAASLAARAGVVRHAQGATRPARGSSSPSTWRPRRWPRPEIDARLERRAATLERTGGLDAARGRGRGRQRAARSLQGGQWRRGGGDVRVRGRPRRTACWACASRPGPPGSGGPPPRPAGPPLEDADAVKQTRAMLDARAAAGQYSGVTLLARGDQLLMSQAWGLADREKKTANTPHTRFNVGSIGKLFTRTAVAQLAEQGKLSLDDKLSQVPARLPARRLHHPRHAVCAPLRCRRHLQCAYDAMDRLEAPPQSRLPRVDPRPAAVVRTGDERALLERRLRAARARSSRRPRARTITATWRSTCTAPQA